MQTSQRRTAVVLRMSSGASLPHDSSQMPLTTTHSETNNIACHGAPGVSNTAGAALWTIDYALQAASLGIKELFFHEGIGNPYNFVSVVDLASIPVCPCSPVVRWQLQPISLNRSIVDGSPLDPPVPPHIQPGFYGGVVINSFIGSTGTSTLVELDVGDSNVSAYAVFAGGSLVRAVFVNLHAWLLSSTGDRPSVHVDLDFAGGEAFQGRSASLRRLVVGHADDTEGLTWAGQSYENSNVSAQGNFAIEQVDLSEGFDIRSTEAVLLEFTTL